MTNEQHELGNEMRIKVSHNGPYEVTGGIPLAKQQIGTDSEGQSREWLQGQEYQVAESYELCRCGHSGDKPFCDGTHNTISFKGRERASRRPYVEQAEEFDGPEMLLTDAVVLCAFARFCDADGQIWNLIEETDDSLKRDLVTRQAGHCPGGRLVAWSKSPREAIEPALEPSLGLVEDPQMGVSGPIWVRGGIEIVSSDGTPYETRNRVALCRCGASANKPFCDGTHASIRFSDES
jgi:CDGSH-type Zn-finger protein